jgi:hypothetical protein
MKSVAQQSRRRTNRSECLAAMSAASFLKLSQGPLEPGVAITTRIEQRRDTNKDLTDSTSIKECQGSVHDEKEGLRSRSIQAEAIDNRAQN